MQEVVLPKEKPKALEHVKPYIYSAEELKRIFGLILLSIGIMGIYLMNILNEAKKMPHYVIRREDTDE